MGTYITRVHRPTLFPRVMHRTIFSRDTRDMGSKRSCSCIRVTIKTLRVRASLEFIRNDYQVTYDRTIHHNYDVLFPKNKPNVSIFVLHFQYKVVLHAFHTNTSLFLNLHFDNLHM